MGPENAWGAKKSQKVYKMKHPNEHCDPLCGSAQKGLYLVLETPLETRVMAF